MRKKGLIPVRTNGQILMGLDWPSKPATPSTLGGPIKLPKSHNVGMEQRANPSNNNTSIQSSPWMRECDPRCGFIRLTATNETRSLSLIRAELFSPKVQINGHEDHGGIRLSEPRVLRYYVREADPYRGYLETAGMSEPLGRVNLSQGRVCHEG